MACSTGSRMPNGPDNYQDSFLIHLSLSLLEPWLV